MTEWVAYSINTSINRGWKKELLYYKVQVYVYLFIYVFSCTQISREPTDIQEWNKDQRYLNDDRKVPCSKEFWKRVELIIG